MSGEDELERASILLVDDRPSNLQALQVALARPDYDLVLAGSGEEALRAVLRHEFAVILLDVAMPRMTGFEAAAILKERDRSRRVPIIFVTASAYDMEHIYRAYDVGAVDCLRKPVDPHELRSKVGVFVELFRQRRRIEGQAREIREAQLREQRLLLVRAETALRESEALYQLTFEEAPVGIGQANPDARWVRVNQRLCEILGHTREDLLRGSLPELASGSQAELIAAGLDSLRSGEARLYVREHEIRRSDGAPTWIHLTVSTLRGPDGGIARFIAVLGDVTERRRLEAERGRLLAELREGIRARDDFLVIAAHELKTPMTPLRLLIGSLLHRLRRTPDQCSPEDVERRVRRLDEAAQRVETMVDRLLEVSRMSIGQLSLEREELDLAVLVSRVVARVAAEGEGTPATITVAASAPVIGRFDRLRMEEVVGCLLSNALKYGAERPVEVALAGDGERARLDVRDHGIGIPAESQGRIFERFERLAPVQSYGGFGLGLWIVRLIVEAHGGTVSVKSRSGEGSVFTVELPLRPTEGDLAPSPSAPRDGEEKRARAGASP